MDSNKIHAKRQVFKPILGAQFEQIKDIKVHVAAELRQIWPPQG